MHFPVKFCSPGGSWAVNLPRAQVGIDFLDRVRGRLGENIDAKLVDSICDALAVDPTLELDEAVARASGRFRSTCEVEVKVPASGLNRFHHIEARLVGTQYVPVYETDTDAVISEWAVCGYPLEWKPATEPLRVAILEARRAKK